MVESSEGERGRIEAEREEEGVSKKEKKRVSIDGGGGGSGDGCERKAPLPRAGESLDSASGIASLWGTAPRSACPEPSKR